jgi:protein-tyrosine phosphatase
VASRSRPAPGQARILLVCTGNLCRSPMAEGLLAHALAGTRPDISVRSAGTLAATGEPMERFAASQLERLSAPLPGFLTQPLTELLVVEADLVLTAARDHRATVVRLVPEAASRSFTLGEISRLLTDVPPGERALSPTRLAAVAAARRGKVKLSIPEDDDLADPYGRSRLAFARCAEDIRRLLSAPVAALTGRLGSTS